MTWSSTDLKIGLLRWWKAWSSTLFVLELHLYRNRGDFSCVLADSMFINHFDSYLAAIDWQQANLSDSSLAATRCLQSLKNTTNVLRQIRAEQHKMPTCLDFRYKVCYTVLQIQFGRLASLWHTISRFPILTPTVWPTQHFCCSEFPWNGMYSHRIITYSAPRICKSWLTQYTALLHDKQFCYEA